MPEVLIYIEQVLLEREQFFRCTVLRQLEDYIAVRICQSQHYLAGLNTIVYTSQGQNLIIGVILLTGVWLRAAFPQHALVLLLQLVGLSNTSHAKSWRFR